MSRATGNRPLPAWFRRGLQVTLIGLPLLGILTVLGHRALDAMGAASIRTVRTLGVSHGLPQIGDPAFLSAFFAATRVPFSPGHRIELLNDGPATLARLEQDLLGARRSIAFQTYFCEPGRVADRIKEVLIARAREGIPVLFLKDGFGCSSLGNGYNDSLTAAGVAVAVLRPLHWYSLHRAQHRSHVRAVIVDGTIGYTGGFGLADKWLPHDGEPGWRESTVRFTGPSVGQLAGAFAGAWAEATGALLADPRFPTRDSVGAGPLATLLYSTWQYGTPLMERYLGLVLAGARRRVFLTSPYFIPNEDLRSWLTSAVKRGVDVRVLTAGPDVDIEWTRWAARTHYEDLLEAGIRIYEYRGAMLHAKTVAVDGVLGSVGSLNLDNVSLRMNDESVLVVQDSGFTEKLEAAFEADLARSKEISLDEFRRRPWHERLRESLALLVRPYL